MKINHALKALCLMTILFIQGQSASSQCTNGATPMTVAYDTTVYGGGNELYNFAFPQFNPDLGTLISVNLETIVTLRYAFQMENHNSSGSLHRVKVTRIDELTFPGGSQEKVNSSNLGSYYLQGSDGIIGSGPDYIQDGPLYAFRDLKNNYDLTGGLAGFLGNGTAYMDYSTNSMANSVSNLNSSLTGKASDTIKFKITYQYCKTAFLPAEILNFSASRTSPERVDLLWVAPNDQQGTRYEIEKSADGRKFTRFESIVSNSNLSSSYQARYSITQEDNNRLFFRIKETGADAEVKYSQIRVVSVPNNRAGDMKVYPTVSSGSFSISFQEGSKEDYLVSVYGMAGNLVQQQKYLKTNFVHYTAKSPMKPGMYFVVAENIKTKESQKSKIIIQ